VLAHAPALGEEMGGDFVKMMFALKILFWPVKKIL